MFAHAPASTLDISIGLHHVGIPRHGSKTMRDQATAAFRNLLVIDKASDEA
jgi:hypothetical protein